MPFTVFFWHVVVHGASQSVASYFQYADPVADLLDKQGVFSSRLFRESCVFHKGNYVKDLSLIGRDLNKVIIIDNSPASYVFHPDNAVSVNSTMLKGLCCFSGCNFACELTLCLHVLSQTGPPPQVDCSIYHVFAA